MGQAGWEISSATQATPETWEPRDPQILDQMHLGGLSYTVRSSSQLSHNSALQTVLGHSSCPTQAL